MSDRLKTFYIAAGAASITVIVIELITRHFEKKWQRELEEEIIFTKESHHA